MFPLTFIINNPVISSKSHILFPLNDNALSSLRHIPLHNISSFSTLFSSKQSCQPCHKLNIINWLARHRTSSSLIILVHLPRRFTRSMMNVPHRKNGRHRLDVGPGRNEDDRQVNLRGHGARQRNFAADSQTTRTIVKRTNASLDPNPDPLNLEP